MRNFIALTKSVLKGNVGFTIGLILMFAFSICLIEAMCVVPTSMSETFNKFYDEYNMHESYIYYDGLKEDAGKEIEQIRVDGVRAVDEQKYVTCRIKDEQNNIFSAILFSNSESKDREAKVQLYLESIEHVNNKTDSPSVKVSRYFALHNNLHAGDYLYVADTTKTNYHKLFVSDIIVSPETMHTFKDETSWCESGNVPFLYMEENDIDTIFNSTNFYNVCYLYFNEDVKQESKQTIMDNFCSAADITTIDSIVLQDTERYKAFKRITTALAKTLSYIPFLILFLTFICTFLFIRQVITRESPLYTLLTNLGYRTRQTRRVFSLYTTIFLVVAFVIGLAAGIVVLEFFIQIFKDAYNLPYFITNINVAYFAFLILLMILVCYSSTFINFYSVARKINKANAGLETKQKGNHAEKVKTKKQTRFKNVFIQNCLAQMKREWVRTLATCGCLACAYLLTFCGVAIFFSYYAENEYTYTEYLKYDSQIYVNESETSLGDFENSLKNVDNVDCVEPISETYTEAGRDADMQQVMLRGIVDDGKLVTPVDADKNQLYPNDGVIVEEYFAKYYDLKEGDNIQVKDAEFRVEGIARECVNQTLYVADKNITKVYEKPARGFLITLSDNAKNDKNLERDTYLKISEIKGYEHKAILQEQRAENNHFSNSITLFNYIILIEALMVGLIVVINTVHLNIHMRKREYATLLALGTKMRHFFQSCAIEYLIMYVLSVSVGIGLGYIAADKLLYLMSSSSNVYYFVHQNDAILITILITFMYVIIGVVYTLRRIRHLNYTVILNDRE